MNPLYLMLPGGIACTYAFMLPVATPPNAIVFSYGHLRVIDMVSINQTATFIKLTNKHFRYINCRLELSLLVSISFNTLLSQFKCIIGKYIFP